MPSLKHLHPVRSHSKESRVPSIRPRTRRVPVQEAVSEACEWRYCSRSAAETDRLGRMIGQALRGGEVVALCGELGTGKTALVRGIAAGLGAPPRAVSSPTFVLIHEYHGRLPLAHADLYRIQTETELAHLGLSDYLDGHTVVAVEWADKAGTDLPPDRLQVYLAHRGKTARDLALQATGARSRDLLARVMKRCKPREPASRRAVTERAR